jgi:hypothetical protein
LLKALGDDRYEAMVSPGGKLKPGRRVHVAPGFDVEIEEVPASTWQRASTPPLNAVLDPTPTATGEPLRPWQQALADYVPILRRQRAAAVR